MKDYKQLAQNFNTARLQMNEEVLSGAEMYTMLTKVVGFGKDSSLLSLLTKKNIIRRIGRNQYMFPQLPVYYGKLQVVMMLHNKKKNVYSLSKAIRICQDYGYTITYNGKA